MLRFAKCLNMLILLFVCLEPLHSFGSEQEFKNYFNMYKTSPTLSNNDGRRDSLRYTALNQNEEKGINEIIKRLFPVNATVAPRAAPSPQTSPPKSTSQKINSLSLTHKSNFDENITTSYYATYDENYPDYAVIADKLKKFSGFVLKDSLPKQELIPHTLTVADKENYRHLCRSEVELINPRVIMDEHNKNVRIVNYPEFEQTIRFEKCGDPEGTCTYGEGFANNMKPICKQNYIFRQVLTITETEDVVVKSVAIPSCCECVLKDLSLE